MDPDGPGTLEDGTVFGTSSKPGRSCWRQSSTGAWRICCTADTRWLASAAAVAPVPAGVTGGITSEEEEEEAQLESLNEWMEAAGFPRGVAAYDFSDPQSGEQKAVFDLVWPNGIQEELSQPVAVLLNEERQTLALASQAGFRCFTGIDEFKRYVTVEILGEGAAA